MAKKRSESCVSILLKMTVLITVLLAIIVGGVFFAYQKLNEFFNRGGTIEVPDFRGKHIVEVMKNKPKGLEIVRRDEKFDERYSRDHVLAQFPEPGTVVRPGKKIQLSISLGLQKVRVPKLTENNLREVDLALLNAQLSPGNRAYVYSDDIPHDRVVNQSPLPDAEFGVNKKVDLLISLGRKTSSYPLPDLAGSNLDDARKKVKSWGFNLGRVYSKKDPNKPKFQVISTHPSPYSSVRKGDVISILISAGDDAGTADWKDLRKFEIFSGAESNSVEEVSTPEKRNNPIVSPPRILIADDSNASPIKNNPINIPASNQVSEKQLSFVMPDGFMPKEVKFIHISNQGRKQIYSGTHKPLDLVKVNVPNVPNSKVQIYINDVPIEERKIEQ